MRKEVGSFLSGVPGGKEDGSFLCEFPGGKEDGSRLAGSFFMPAKVC
jgi:hypothetical protein